MYGSIFSKNLFDKKISTLVWSGSMFLFALLFAALFETVSGELSEFVDSFPEAFSAIIGDISKGTTPSGWLGIELYGLFLPLILAIVGSNSGASTIGKEEDSGTLELILASPISRSKIILQKALAIVAQLFVISMGAWVGAAIGSLLFNFDVNLIHVFWASFAGWLLGLVYSVTSLATQAITGKRGLAIGVGSGAVALTYLANVVSQLVDSLEFLKYLSPFHYFNVESVLDGNLTFGYMAILAVISAFLYLVAHVSFVLRDTGV